MPNIFQIIKKLPFSIFVFVLIVSCNDAITISETQTLRQLQLENVYNNEIFPNYTGFYEEMLKLEEQVQIYSAAPSLPSFESLRSQWVTTSSQWKKCEMLYFGPVRDKFLHNRVYKWPVDVSKINDVLEGSETINSELIEGQGSNSIGLSAIEYLIFDPEISPADLHANLSTYPRKLEYLLALSSQLSTVSSEMNEDWLGYQNEFQLRLGSGLDGGQTILLNSMLNHLELVVNTKVGKPLGKASGITSPNDSEAFRSQKSLEFLTANLITLQRVFSGNFTPVGHRTGFEDFLFNAGHEELMQQILDQFSICRQDIANINTPLSSAIIDSNPAAMKLYNDLVDLLVLIKVDMANILGSTITFTDNDGD